MVRYANPYSLLESRFASIQRTKADFFPVHDVSLFSVLRNAPLEMQDSLGFRGYGQILRDRQLIRGLAEQ